MEASHQIVDFGQVRGPFERLAVRRFEPRQESLHPGVGAGPAPGHCGPDPVARLRGQAVRLLAACAAAGPTERRVVIGDRELAASMVAVAGAIEIAVHGWDISAACGASRPVPPGLAAVLLPIAPLLITPGSRPGLFAEPVRLAGPAGPGDQLVAFLGRRPHLPAAPF